MNERYLIEQIIPYVEENFITFPLWEEGNYGPQVNIWRIFNKFEELDEFTSQPFQTPHICVFFDVEEIPTTKMEIIVNNDNEIQFIDEPTGEIKYKVNINIMYEHENAPPDLYPLLAVAANIALFKPKKG